MPINADRMNRLQIVEQEKINRERKLQEELEGVRRQQRLERSRAKFDYVNGTVFSGARAPNAASRKVRNQLNSCGEDAEVRVFIRECDSEGAKAFVYRESDILMGDENIAQLNHGFSAQRGAPQRASGNPKSPAIRVKASPAHREKSSAVPSYSLAQVCEPGEGEKSKLGHVPRYLELRKAELAEAKRAAAEERDRLEHLSKIPPGHRFVPEEEKTETVKVLNSRLEELEMQLRKIPVRFDTLGIRQKRQVIEEEMALIEEAIRRYSTKRPLYVPLSTSKQ